MLLSAKMDIGGKTIGKNEILMMGQATITIFEILEKAWSQQGISLIDMKVEYGVCPENGEIVLADVVDNDSWRLWPGGDRRLQLDKQFYRDLPEVTEESLKQLKKNFAEVISKLEKFKTEPRGRVVVVAGSKSDQDHCLAIKRACETNFGLPCAIRFCSAHKNTARVLELAAEFEGDSIPTVFIAVAGLSNGLGPVLAGNVRCPVINCPPPSQNSEDLFSSLNMPS
uniref:PurE domain-containing protein n=1 Tax=Romanomermis culicivorax TaxID=13658 RepID=A0A915I6I5_ROMCU